MFGFFSFFWGILGFGIAAAGSIFAFAFFREYTRKRLRFVDAVRSPIVPWVVGIGVAILAMPVIAIFAFLHLVGGGTALLLGAASGVGTASGVKALRRGD